MDLHGQTLSVLTLAIFLTLIPSLGADTPHTTALPATPTGDKLHASGTHSGYTDTTSEVPLEQDLDSNEINNFYPPTAGRGDIKTLVKTLQLQLKESQQNYIHTRSIINVIQDKQESQDKDMASLKNEIGRMKTKQSEHHKSVMLLQTTVSNSDWAMKDLKAGQLQINKDFLTVKTLLQHQNTTTTHLQNTLHQQDLRYRRHFQSFRITEQELYRVRKSLQDGTIRMKELEERVRKFRVVDPTRDVPTGTPTQPHTATDDSFNSVPGTAQTSDTTSTRPDRTGRHSELDVIASSTEEAGNVIHRNVNALLEKGEKLTSQLNNMSGKFVKYDVEMSRLYTLFYNLSLQMATFENKMLHTQHKKQSDDFNQVQGMFVNFTTQLMNLQEWRMSSHLYFNTTSQNRDVLTQVLSQLESHKSRLQAIDNLMVEYRSANQQNNLLLNSYIMRLNETVHDFRSEMQDHHTKAAEMFRNAEHRFMEFHTRVQHNDDRLAKVELRLVNATLSECQKINTDLVQDVKLSDMSQKVSKIGETQGQKEVYINKIDRGLSKLYHQVAGQDKVVTHILNQTKTLMGVLPHVAQLQVEVNNFMAHLPRDCDEQFLIHPHLTNGVYLIKPEGATRSLRTYCEYYEDSSWTTVQRRVNGHVSFARPWAEYKDGFGNAENEFWIGNDNLHYLTNQGSYTLQISMTDTSNRVWVAEYDHFKIENEDASYRLHISGYHGNATDALKYSNYLPFSTLDRDNDVSSTHCAKFYTSGWWYKHCHYCNLNGRYTVGIVWFNHDHDEWFQMKESIMKVRPVTDTTKQSVPGYT